MEREKDEIFILWKIFTEVTFVIKTKCKLRTYKKYVRWHNLLKKYCLPQ